MIIVFQTLIEASNRQIEEYLEFKTNRGTKSPFKAGFGSFLRPAWHSESHIFQKLFIFSNVTPSQRYANPFKEPDNIRNFASSNSNRTYFDPFQNTYSNGHKFKTANTFNQGFSSRGRNFGANPGSPKASGFENTRKPPNPRAQYFA